MKLTFACLWPYGALLLAIVAGIAWAVWSGRVENWRWQWRAKRPARCECHECDPVAGLRNPCDRVTTGGWDNEPPFASEPPPVIFPRPDDRIGPGGYKERRQAPRPAPPYDERREHNARLEMLRRLEAAETPEARAKIAKELGL